MLLDQSTTALTQLRSMFLFYILFLYLLLFWINYKTKRYWQGKITREELVATGAALRKANWLTQRDIGINLIPSND